MQFNIRAALAGMFLAAVAAFFVSKSATTVAAFPGCLWILGVGIGALKSRGRGIQCVLFSALGGTIGGLAASLLIHFSDQMGFPIWYSPLVVIALCALGGGVLGGIVRVIIEGVTLRKPGHIHDEQGPSR